MMLSTVPVCMDSTDWSQSMQMQERSFRPGQEHHHQDLLSCSRPMLDRRLKPQPEQAVKCPRCESTNTKFCYYNNYSLSQPRHFCKTCRRYWTKGGALRTVPVGGGCRKNKRAKRTSGDQPAGIVNTQNEASNNSGTSSAGNGSVITTCTPLDQNRANNPCGNSTSSVYFNLPCGGPSDINLALARLGSSDQSAVGNYGNSSDFLGLSCGSSTQSSSFGHHSSLGSLNTIGSLGNLSALNTFHSLKSGFPGLVDFPISHRTADQGAQLVLASEWQMPSENIFEQGGDSSSYWTGGPWSDLASYGSSISPSM